MDSPALQACFDAPLARQQGVVDMRAALLDVGALQVLSHFGGEYHCAADGQVRGYVRERDGSLTPESYYAEFARGLAEIGYEATSATSCATRCRWSTEGRSGSSSPTRTRAWPPNTCVRF